MLIVSSRNSTLDVEFPGEGGVIISSRNSTLGMESVGEGGFEKSAGVGEKDGLEMDQGGESGATRYVRREESEGAGDGDRESRGTSGSSEGAGEVEDRESGSDGSRS